MLGEKIVIILGQEDLFELERIVIDEDRDSALKFLRGVIKKQVDHASRAHCRPVFELGTKEVKPPGKDESQG